MSFHNANKQNKKALRLFHLFIFILTLFGYSNFSHAQSDNYWSQNFNTRSSLLAGAVVGGNAGVSAVFYNPALITDIEHNNLVLNVSLFSFRGLKLVNVFGEDITKKEFNFKVLPKFISYVKSHKNNEKINFEFSFLTRAFDEIEVNYTHLNQLELLQKPEGEEHYTAIIDMKRKYSDKWFGAGMSYKMSDRFSIGGSAFLSIKTMRYQFGYDLKSFPQTDTVIIDGEKAAYYTASQSLFEQLNYWHLSAILKLGLHYVFPTNGWQMGMSFTLPSIGIYGEAQAVKSLSRSNVYDGTNEIWIKNFDITDAQNNRKVTIKDPFSIALGVVREFGSKENSLSFTMEYFHRIDEYEIINSSTGKAVTTKQNLELIGDSKLLNFRWKADPILNVALGYAHVISPKFDLRGGVRTDFNARNNHRIVFTPQLPDMKIIHYDKFHITTGGTYFSTKVDVLLGLQYTFGRKKNQENLINLADPIEYNPSNDDALQGIRQNNMTVQHHEFSLFFGLTYSFTQKSSRSLE